MKKKMLFLLQYQLLWLLLLSYIWYYYYFIPSCGSYVPSPLKFTYWKLNSYYIQYWEIESLKDSWIMNQHDYQMTGSVIWGVGSLSRESDPSHPSSIWPHTLLPSGLKWCSKNVFLTQVFQAWTLHIKYIRNQFPFFINHKSYLDVQSQQHRLTWTVFLGFPQTWAP